MTRRLRVAHVVVQPVVVWDDGEELSPGPPAKAITVPLSGLASLAEQLAAEAAAVADESEQ